MQRLKKAIELISYLNEFVPEWDTLENIETLAMMFPDISEDEEELLSVIVSLTLNDTAWAAPFVFENVVDAINGNQVITGMMTKPPLQDIMYAIDIMKMIKDQNFSPAICFYIAAIGVDEGLLWLPPKLGFAQDYMKQILITMGSDLGVPEAERDIVLNEDYDDGLLEAFKDTLDDENDVDDEAFDSDIIRNQINKISLIHRLYKLKTQ